MAEYLLLRENIIKDLVTLVSILAGSLEGGSSLISCGTTIGALQGLQRSKKNIYFLVLHHGLAFDHVLRNLLKVNKASLSLGLDGELGNLCLFELQRSALKC